MRKIFLHENHARPVTRRDFLSQGLIGSSGFVLAPTVLGMLLKANLAHAANCGEAASGGAVLPAVLIFDHAGGAGLLHQTLPFSVGDQPLDVTGYRALGMPAGQDPITGTGVLDESWGIRYHARLSFVQELNANAIAEAKARTTGFSVLGQLNDDTSNNRTNPGAGIALLGALGDADRHVASVLGSSSSESGGNSSVAVSSPLHRSVPITTAKAAADLASIGALATRLGNDRKLAGRVMRAVQNMAQGQLKRYSSQDLPSQINDLVGCGYVKASALAGEPTPGSPSLDPAADATVTQVFNFADGLEQRTGTLAYLLAMGFAGVATVELGGRDYHDNTRATGEAKDREAARLTAKAINLFHRYSQLAGTRPRPLYVIHLTDGGVSTDGTADGNANGFSTWTSDRGSASAAYVLAYDPAAKPAAARQQLGFSTKKDGGVDQALAPFSGNAVALAETLMINWLSFAGRSPGDLKNAISQPVLSNADISKYAILSRKS